MNDKCEPATTLLIGIKWVVDEWLSEIACDTLSRGINVKSMFELKEMSNDVPVPLLCVCVCFTSLCTASYELHIFL